MMADPEDASVQRLPAAGLPSARPPGSIPAVPDAKPEHDSQADHLDQLARSIIRSKVQPPPVRPSTLERPRLLQWLYSHSAERLILVTGEAGYGKTTLLADFARRSAARCLWYRLDATDRDWVTFINYLIAAIREAIPDFGSETAALLAQLGTANPPLEVVLTSLISELPAIGSAPTLLILDDFHVVDESPDVQAILARFFERAPQNLSFLLASRVAPSVRIGRLAAHGEVARIATDDLRFSPEETADLFAVAYQLPLEPDLVDEIDARAEGWVASLQLVYSSIRERRPSEARAFIQSLSGAEGALYDYLAEEVLCGLAAPLQRVLVRASLLERVVPSYVMASLSTDREAPAAAQVTALLDEADRLGLMGRRAVGASTRRFHPLLREYLRRQLDTGTTADDRRDMHRRVARAAEQASDWLAACHHFIEGDEPAEAMRVLSNSAAVALGSGALGASMALVGRIGATETPSAVKVIQARHLISIGAIDRAAEVLDQLDGVRSPPEERALLALAQVHAAFKTGRADLMERHVEAVLRDPELPTNLSDIARAWRLMMAACRGGDIRAAARFLGDLGERQARADQPYFAAISLHNAAMYELARGQYLTALRLADRALAEFGRVDGDSGEGLSTRAIVATACLELGYSDRAEEETRRLLRSAEADPDAYIDCAWNAAITGEQERATEFLLKAEEASQLFPSDPGMRVILNRCGAMLAITAGGPATAGFIIDEPSGFALEPDFLVRNWLARSQIEAEVTETGSMLRRALRFANSQGASRLSLRLAIGLASVDEDGPAMVLAINRVADAGPLGLLEMADVVCRHLHALPALPATLIASIRQWPSRWLPALRREMGRGNAPSAHVAARLLADHGALSDASRLVAFEKTYLRSSRNRSLSRSLILRASPTMTVHDLGRTIVDIAASEVDLAKARRRAASLLMYLVTRPNRTATREQVTEELWPDLEPGAAINSFNQTLYFLRRDIDPWYDDATSADYVVNQSELIWLDPTLTKADSVSFFADATEWLSSPASVANGVELIRRYRGRFSPEFEYEEWAIGWRERLHALYLLVVHATESNLVERGDYGQAVDVLLSALSVDPDALEVEVNLIRALRRVGANAAAAEQYAHLARSYRAELGVEPPSFDSLAPSPNRSRDRDRP